MQLHCYLISPGKQRLPTVVLQPAHSQAGWRGARETDHPHPAAATKTGHAGALGPPPAFFLQNDKPTATTVRFPHGYQGERQEGKGRVSDLSLGLLMLLRNVFQESILCCRARQGRRCFLKAAVLRNTTHKDAFEIRPWPTLCFTFCRKMLLSTTDSQLSALYWKKGSVTCLQNS